MAGRRLLLGNALLLCLIGICLLGIWCPPVSADIPVTILEKSPVVRTRGANMTLSCQMGQGIEMFLTYSMRWMRKSPAKGMTDSTPVLISTKDKLSSAVDHDRYEAMTSRSANSLIVSLHIANVTKEDEGRYICQVTTIQHSTVTNSSEIDVHVTDGAHGQLLKVDGRKVESSTKLTAGSHTVQCFVEGVDSEGQTVSLSLDIQKITSILNTSRAHEPENLVWAEATVSLTDADNGKTLSCQVNQGGSKISTTINIVAEPSVHCEDVTVRRSDKHVQLACEVTHAGFRVFRFDWEYDTIDISEDAARNNATVTKISDTKTRVSRRLDVAQWVDTRNPFTLTADTEAGEVSGHADVIVEGDDDGHDGDHDHDDGDKSGGDNLGGGDGKSRAQSGSRMTWDHALLLLVMAVFLRG